MHANLSDLGAFALAARHVNASVRDAVGERDLLAALIAEETPSDLETHVRAFYDETDVETLSDIACSGLIGYGRMAAGARQWLPTDHETRIWLDERA